MYKFICNCGTETTVYVNQFYISCLKCGKSERVNVAQLKLLGKSKDFKKVKNS